MDNNAEVQNTEILSKDQILSKIEGITGIQDEAERKTQAEDFVKDRLKFLNEHSIPRSVSLVGEPVEGFLHPASEVRRTFIFDPFHVDDPDIYLELIESVEELKTSPNWQGKSMKDIVPQAITTTIGRYFGNHYPTESTEIKNQDFYLDRISVDSEPIHLKELKGKGIGVCAEKSAVAQNLLSFLGYKSQIIASSKCRLNSPERDDNTGHMYNVITGNGMHVIFDPANPKLAQSQDGTVYAAWPSLYPIGQQEYATLLKGGTVEVAHYNYIWDGQQALKGTGQKRIYGGPNTATPS